MLIVRTILLSFKPEPFFEPLKDGRKRFEYRSRFGEGEHIAYLYLTFPYSKDCSKNTFWEEDSAK